MINYKRKNLYRAECNTCGTAIEFKACNVKEAESFLEKYDWVSAGNSNYCVCPDCATRTVKYSLTNMAQIMADKEEDDD